jgi:hypothetical protein
MWEGRKARRERRAVTNGIRSASDLPGGRPFIEDGVSHARLTHSECCLNIRINRRFLVARRALLFLGL